MKRIKFFNDQILYCLVLHSFLVHSQYLKSSDLFDLQIAPIEQSRITFSEIFASWYAHNLQSSKLGKDSNASSSIFCQNEKSHCRLWTLLIIVCYRRLKTVSRVRFRSHQVVVAASSRRRFLTLHCSIPLRVSIHPSVVVASRLRYLSHPFFIGEVNLSNCSFRGVPSDTTKYSPSSTCST